MLNAVINEKKEICEKNHIRFVIHVKLPENIDTIEPGNCFVESFG